MCARVRRRVRVKNGSQRGGPFFDRRSQTSTLYPCGHLSLSFLFFSFLSFFFIALIFFMSLVFLLHTIAYLYFIVTFISYFLYKSLPQITQDGSCTVASWGPHHAAPRVSPCTT